jgi:hypothetical protein
VPNCLLVKTPTRAVLNCLLVKFLFNIKSMAGDIAENNVGLFPRIVTRQYHFSPSSLFPARTLRRYTIVLLVKTPTRAKKANVL